jgi:hypothetical protein
MKWTLVAVGLMVFGTIAGQDNNKKYPVPEYEDEIYYLNKDNNTLVRLEKGNSGLKTKLKMAGLGGSENDYEIENDKSPVRLPGGGNLSFIYYTGGSEGQSYVSADTAHSQNQGGSSPFSSLEMMNDPSHTTTLYSAFPGQDERKVVVQSGSGMRILGKAGQSKKYSFSIRKIKSGYIELDVDKSLPKGEYVFVVMGGMEIKMDGSALLFAFGID